MRLMASGTFLVLDRAMMHGILRKKLSHMGQFILINLNGSIMALQAYIHPSRNEKPFVRGHMRFMTVQAARCFHHGRMLNLRRLEIAESFLVAFRTESGSGGSQFISLIRRVGIVAIGAVFRNRLMLIFGVLQPCVHLDVAGKTHLTAVDSHELGRIASVRIVAGYTGADSKRTVQEAALEFVFGVALLAELLGCISQAGEASGSRNLMA